MNLLLTDMRTIQWRSFTYGFSTVYFARTQTRKARQD